MIGGMAVDQGIAMFMNFQMNFCSLLFLALVIITIVMIVKSMRRPGGWTVTHTACPGCGQDHPRHAQYCRRCGQKL
jgi:hypothetical protein